MKNTNNINITVKFDQDQYTSVRQDYRVPVLDANTANAQTLFPARNTAAVADTGASVDCSGIEILKMMGIGRRLLLPTSTVLRTENKQKLTVLGLVPVIIGTMSADKETVVKEKVMFYVVKELQPYFSARTRWWT